MALARFQANVLDASGNVVPGASVEVRNEASGALVPLYTDRNGTVSAGNPVFADSDGFFYFHVMGGAYEITATSGSLTRTWRWQAVGTAGETDDVSSQGGAFQNIITGGDFTTNPWQRGTSFTGGIAAAQYYPDRFVMDVFTGGGTADLFKTVDAPTITQAGVATQHCLHIDVTTADSSIAAADRYGLQYRVEGITAAAFGFGAVGAASMTVSFWHKHTKVGTYSFAVKNSANDRCYIAEYTQAVSDAWEKAVITIPGDTTGTWLSTTATVGMRLVWMIACGTDQQTAANVWTAGNFRASPNQVNGMDSTSNNFKLALVKAEMGLVDHPWFPLPSSVVLVKCHRFYRKSFELATAPAQNAGTFLGAHYLVSQVAATLFGSRVTFDRMCKVPTITTYNPQAANANWRDTTNAADRAVTVNNPSETGFAVSGAAGAAAAENWIHWTANAEL